MNNFEVYFKMGIEHILNRNALDHILFVLALTMRDGLAQWRKILLLLTAFTIGHCIALVLVVYHIVVISPKWIEFLIPVTILVAILINLSIKSTKPTNFTKLLYFVVLAFGIIHGFGFSESLINLIGNRNDTVWKLLYANLGIEFGQICIVLLKFLCLFLVIKIFKIKEASYVLFVSGFIFGIALILAIERLPF